MQKKIGFVVFALIWIGIPVYTGIRFGTSGVEKVLTAFAMFVGLLWSAISVTALIQFARGRNRDGIGYLLFSVLLWLVGNEVVASKLNHLIDSPDTSASIADDLHLTHVVLWGGSTRLAPSGLAELANDGHSLLLAAQWWHSKRADHVIVTGGSTVFASGATPYAEQSEQLLVSVGVPNESITRLGGQNTREEMQELKVYCTAKRLSMDRVGLITNAAHMPRAIRLAAKHDLTVVPLPCASRDGLGGWAVIHLIPSYGGVEANSVACYELLARLAGQ